MPAKIKYFEKEQIFKNIKKILQNCYKSTTQI